MFEHLNKTFTLHKQSTTTASTVTYLTPLVAVIVGAIVLGERITWNEPAGALLVIAGAAIAQGVLVRRRSYLSTR
jgi:drug/metabolite transporter (DMT)-like permease